MKRDGFFPLDYLIAFLFGAAVMSVLYGVFPKPCHAQTTTLITQPTVAPIDSGVKLPPFNYGYIDDSARVMLEQMWVDWDSTQVERAYCVRRQDVTVTRFLQSWSDEWHVHHVVPAAVDVATPYEIHYSCPDSTVGVIHIHTPTTCKNVGQSAMTPVWACQKGGKDAYVCANDEADEFFARHEGAAFSIVQCDKHAFVWYWPGKRQ